jgi:hypothetical protein
LQNQSTGIEYPTKGKGKIIMDIIKVKMPLTNVLLLALIVIGLFRFIPFAHEALTTGTNPMKGDIQNSQLYKGHDADLLDKAGNAVSLAKTTAKRIDSGGSNFK